MTNLTQILNHNRVGIFNGQRNAQYIYIYYQQLSYEHIS